jgi:hypothetical protein
VRFLSPESLVVRLYSELDDRERIQAGLSDHSEGAAVAEVTNEGVLRPEPLPGVQAGHGQTVRRLATGTGDGGAGTPTMLLSRTSFPTTGVGDIEPSLWGTLAVNATTDG